MGLSPFVVLSFASFVAMVNAVFHKTFTQHVTCRACGNTQHVAQHCSRTYPRGLNPYLLLIVWLDGTPPTLFTIPLSDPLQNAEKVRCDKDTVKI